MNQPEPTLPFFVYGTLRKAYTNYDLFENAVVDERMGFLENATMTVSSVPFVHVDMNGSGVFGEVITVAADHYQSVLRHLDALEGYSGPGRTNIYDREAVKVRLGTGEYVQCWGYLVTSDRAAKQVLKSGDYTDHGRRR